MLMGGGCVALAAAYRINTRHPRLKLGKCKKLLLGQFFAKRFVEPRPEIPIWISCQYDLCDLALHSTSIVRELSA